ncbi:MAG: hypothetical protein ACYDCT_08095, partial [Dehalococcoidia bacterium]
ESFELEGIAEPAVPIKDWREVMDRFEYDPTAVEITRVDIESVIGRELAGGGWTSMHSAPDRADAGTAIKVEITDDAIRDAIKSTVLEFAEELTVDAGYAAAFKAQVYSAIMQHLRDKFMGASLGLADRPGLTHAWKMLPQVRKRIMSVPGLVGGIIEYGD